MELDECRLDLSAGQVLPRLAGALSWEPIAFLGRISYYDDWYDSEDGEFYSGKSILDLEAAYTWNDNTTIVLGMQNALDETPDDNPSAAAGEGNKYSQYSPFGFNGGFWYVRVTWHAM